MKRVFVILILSVSMMFSACGIKQYASDSNSKDKFYVVSINPPSESLLSEISSIDVVFSEDLYAESVSSNTVFIVSREDYDKYSNDDWKDLYNDVVDGDVVPVLAASQVLSNQRIVRLNLENAILDGSEYIVVVLPKVQSQNFLSLDQTAAGSLKREFVSSFLVASDFEAQSSIGNTGPVQSSSESAANSPDVLAEGEMSTTIYPSVSSADDFQNESESTAENKNENENEEAVVPSFDWQRVLLTEVVVDPQQDHNESAGGNQIPFDGQPGTGTVSSLDEYIEIFNGTEFSVDLSQWNISMKDGTDETQSFSDDSLIKYFSSGGSVTDLRSGEFMVLGNPAGVMNNSILIELFDAEGDLVDSVNVDDGNADGLTDEAIYRSPDGEWMQGFASPGMFLEIMN